MADKAISELVRASIITAADLFVLQQDNTAKCLPGQVLLNWLTAAADGHGGIADWKKVGTSGLVDTYRVTLADTTTFDYYVTNGKAISSVKPTSVSGLTRTYTIAFNDGTTQQFAVTDGRGILSVEQTSVSGLTRTYTISFNDGTTTSFEITDGRSFVRMEKTKTDGLVDTYTIFCNDGSTETLTVTNGEKGDKGDRADIWVRYASQKPTESSHNFGELPDTWIGIATGHNMDAAPTDWKAYDWFQWKGEKGDPGDPATLVSSEIRYQVGDSGTIIPSGSWSASVPVVAQGRYLWTRTTNTFNTGKPVVSYSVTRMGLDGSGSVSSVANISPDANGNVPLTAANIGALPNTGGDMTGEMRMNGNPIRGLNMPTENDQAANMGFVNERVREAAPRNLLDNSYFIRRYVVNQAGVDGLHGTVQYMCDRWQHENKNIITSEQLDDAMKMTFSGLCSVQQKLHLTPGKKYTAAVKVRNVTPGAQLLVMSMSPNNVYIYTSLTNGINVGTFTTISEVPSFTRFCFVGQNSGESIEVEWAALYEGEYTAETLPEYRPKGYGAELLECQRYYREHEAIVVSKSTDATFVVGKIVNMRDMGEYVPSTSLKKFTKPNVTDVTTFTDNDSITIEKVGYGAYNIMRADLLSCIDYDVGTLQFNISADL